VIRPAGTTKEIALTDVGQVGTLNAVHRLFPITPPPRA
jgi:hypothetical protein